MEFHGAFFCRSCTGLGPRHSVERMHRVHVLLRGPNEKKGREKNGKSQEVVAIGMTREGGRGKEMEWCGTWTYSSIESTLAWKWCRTASLPTRSATSAAVPVCEPYLPPHARTQRKAKSRRRRRRMWVYYHNERVIQCSGEKGLNLLHRHRGTCTAVCRHVYLQD